MTTSESRPVYILGAGFSKAISDAMPITNQLGLALKERLDGVIDFDLRDNQSFEDWLTLQITSLPFLDGASNSRRAADASRVIAEIALVLDERVEAASNAESPLWLRQLISLWDAEGAAVLTFNYDTLVERALNSSPLSVGRPPYEMQKVLGDHVVYPAPPAPQPQFAGDIGATHLAGTFQLLKMHGSLAWYWAAGDSNGSTLIRMRERKLFAKQDGILIDTDFSGVTTLDRYLIPPVTSKDGYYGSYLANSLWRSARQIIRTATSLTLVGYSLPLEDRVTSQLVAEVEPSAAIEVVDRNPGSAEASDGVVRRLAVLGLSASAAASGENCVPNFVNSRLRDAVTALPRKGFLSSAAHQNMDVVAAIPNKPGSETPVSLVALVRNPILGVIEGHTIATPYYDASMPLWESVWNNMPHGYRVVDDFVRLQQFRDAIDGGEPFYFQHPGTGEKLVAIDAELFKAGRWETIKIKWAPAGPAGDSA
jgi:hypothetical protein